jgi:hypothetical protein
MFYLSNIAFPSSYTWLNIFPLNELKFPRSSTESACPWLNSDRGRDKLGRNTRMVVRQVSGIVEGSLAIVTTPG